MLQQASHCISATVAEVFGTVAEIPWLAIGGYRRWCLGVAGHIRVSGPAEGSRTNSRPHFYKC